MLAHASCRGKRSVGGTYRAISDAAETIVAATPIAVAAVNNRHRGSQETRMLILLPPLPVFSGWLFNTRVKTNEVAGMRPNVIMD